MGRPDRRRRGGPGDRRGAEVLDFSWSPDGKTLAFLAPDPRSEKEQAAIIGKDDARVLGQNPRMNHLWAAAWPGPAGSSQGDDGDDPVRITGGNFSVQDWDWSPDGRTIAFSHVPSPEPADQFFSDISTVDLETCRVTLLANSGSMRSRPSTPQTAASSPTPPRICLPPTSAPIGST